MAEVLKVQLREARGKHHARRLREAGSVPAVLYGHGEETLCLSVPAEQIDAAVRHASRVVTLEGEVSQQALIRELQWDTWGTSVLHVDFTRISAHERIEVEVPVECRGEAPGLKEGGVVEQVLHAIQIECQATAIPEKLDVNINQLSLNGSISAGDLEVPGSARILCDPEAVVVQCVPPAVVPEEEVVGAEEAEPEVIGRKAAEEGGEEGES